MATATASAIARRIDRDFAIAARSATQRAQQAKDRAAATAKAKSAILACQIVARHPQFAGMVASEVIDGYRQMVERECQLWVIAERLTATERAILASANRQNA